VKKVAILALALTSSLALGITFEEDTALFHAQRDSAFGDADVDDKQYKSAVDNYTSCVMELKAALAKNPALATEIGPRTQPPRTASDLLAYCTQQAEANKAATGTGMVKAKADLAALYKKLSSKFASPSSVDTEAFKACFNTADGLLKSYPDLARANVNEGAAGTAVLGGQVKERCATAFEKSTYASGQMRGSASQDVLKLKGKLDQLMARVKTLRAQKEGTAGEIMVKERDLKKVQDEFQILSDTSSPYREADVRDVKVGNTTAGAVLDQIAAASKQVNGMMAVLGPKADAAYDKQDAQLRVTMLKSAKGERLAVFKLRGIPYSWSGGPTFSKNGVYSGDGVALAKDLMGATTWLYRENSEGCHYYYTFSGNSVVKLDKPPLC
jgi:hypothetical protein